MKEMTLREQQLFSLEILKDVHAFCTSHHIKYSLYGGTLLGAIRHQGFIPWDDDIDIIMPRQDYDRFCSEYLSDNFHIVNVSTDKSFSFAYSRVCDTKKTIYSTKYPCNRDGMGVWIDVFPADGFPANEEDIPGFYQKAVKLEKYKSKIRSGLIDVSSIKFYPIKGLYKQFKSNLSHICFKMLLFLQGWRNPYVQKQIDMCHTFEYGSTPFWGSLTAPYKHVVYHPLSDFESCVLHPFEDGFFYILNGYDGMLRRVYGDYMKLPPEKDRAPQLQGAYEFYWL